ncbi:MAG: aspartate-semialdehyde dehydrogenase [Gammaproteobacteria bacterium]|jgi:aspartate-semialdehyde dehydrogenase|nr:aspartate-semialdehyde dehydrogenase [Gammaproteobacteria bacterium]
MSARLAVVGASGLVGATVLTVLAGRRLGARPLDLVVHRREPTEIPPGLETRVCLLDDYDFAGVELAFFCLDEQGAERHIPRALAAGAWVVDNSSLHRLAPDVPLAVPGVNDTDWHACAPRRIVANPNCSTIQLVHALAPLEERWGLSEVAVATYQAVSGAGREALEDFRHACACPTEALPRPIRGVARPLLHDVVAEIGPLDEEGWSREERKIVRETRRILGRPDLTVRATAVRVPVAVGHGEAVFVRLDRPADVSEVRATLAARPPLRVYDDLAVGRAPSPRVEAAGKDEVAVGRLRLGPDDPHLLSFWIVADNLRRGAATNAVEIAECLLAAAQGAKSRSG